MKQTHLRQVCSSLLFFAISSISIGQLSDEQVRDRANQFTIQLGQPATFQPPAEIRRGSFPGARLRSNSVTIQSREILVTLDNSGTPTGYADMGAGRVSPRSGQERFSNEAAAWAYVETLLHAIHAPTDLTRVKIERRGGDGSGKPTYLLRFEQKPFGYKAQGGNIVSCFIHRITGRILELHIGRGWTYEAPNIQISPQTAKETAARTLGGSANDWNFELDYETSPDTATAPQILQLNQQKVMRLCYNLYSNDGGVIVDSVNGDVVWFGTAGVAVTSPEEAHRKEASQKALVNKSKAEKAKFGIPEILLALAIGIVAIVGGLQLWKMRSG